MSDRSVRSCHAIRLAVLCALAGAGSAHATDSDADSTPLQTVVVQDQAYTDSAITQSPTVTPLEATQPTAVISQKFIQDNMPLTSNFSEIIGLSPSVQSVTPNGPGLMENQTLSIRGFVDGQYNVTFDGIPFQDANDFTHHSTSYFMAHDLGAVEVDYGPGTAATIGNATFCCTIDNRSKDPDAVTTLTPYLSFGSFHTDLYGAQFDTGKIEKWNGAAGFIDAESASSDGALTNMNQRRKNIFAKFDLPLNDTTKLTFVSMYNDIHQNVGLGATAAQIAAYGPSYGLSADPTSQDYYGYNYDLIHTDFEYVGVTSKLGNWDLDNKVYTYAYYHEGHNGEDPNGETPDGTYWGAGDVPGQLMNNNYRSWGDTFNARYTLGALGDIKAGIWADRQDNQRYLYEVDETLGGSTINPDGANYLNGGPVATPGSTIAQPTAADIAAAYSRNLTQKLITLQPYVMFDWNILPNLTLSPGVRFDHFERDVDATVNVKTGNAQSYSNTYSATLPSLLVHYQITGEWAAYLQAAKGFMAPNENYFNYATPGSTNLAPQETWSYQAGTSYQSKRLSLSGDVYYIHFDNEIFKEGHGAATTFFNGGGTDYKGVEMNATFYVGMGFSLYANGSINRAKVITDANTNCATGDCTGGLWVPNAPDATLAYGVIFNQYGFNASLLNKRVGHTYGDVGESQPIPSYSILNGALGYTFGNEAGRFAGASVKVDLTNLTNNTHIFALAGYTALDSTPLYWTIPERSFNVTLSLPIR